MEKKRQERYDSGCEGKRRKEEGLPVFDKGRNEGTERKQRRRARVRS